MYRTRPAGAEKQGEKLTDKTVDILIYKPQRARSKALVGFEPAHTVPGVQGSEGVRGEGREDPRERAGATAGEGNSNGGTKLLPMLLDDGQGKLGMKQTDERSTSDMDISMGSDSEGEGEVVAGELLQPPTLEATGEGVTGLTTDKLRRQNKRKRIQQLAAQQEYSQWRQHQGEIFVSEHEWEERMRQDTQGRQMYPRGRAITHPAGPLLKEWATYGCPTCTGKNWTVEQMQAAIE